MVLLMVPGLGFLYSGLARRKSALSMIYACLGSYSIICFQWYFWGYSLAFSDTATNGFIGNLRKFGLMNTLAVPSPGSTLIPDLLFAFYQMQFCAVTAAIVAGAVAERGRLIPFFVFIFFFVVVFFFVVFVSSVVAAAAGKRTRLDVVVISVSADAAAKGDGTCGDGVSSIICIIGTITVTVVRLVLGLVCFVRTRTG